MAAKHRITHGDDYRRIVRSGYRVGGKHCIAHAVLLNPKIKNNVSHETFAARFGFIITKSVGNAVTRNLIRRRLQHIALEAIRTGFVNADVVFRVFPTAATASYQELETTVLQQLQKIRDMQHEAS